ncbi:hypothetical protein [Mesorhizobium loti]|uniref:hypothetical protein n=1 Tax=Rhizobium loti TaxID=381 RepID=UPI0026B1FE05
MPGEITAFFESRERDPVRAGVGLDHLRGELIESSRRLPIELDGRLEGITDQQVNLEWPETTFVYLDQRLVIPAFAAQLVNTCAPSQNISFPTRLEAASTRLRTECVSLVASTVRLVVLQDGARPRHSCVTVFSWILRLKIRISPPSSARRERPPAAPRLPKASFQISAARSGKSLFPRHSL